MSDNKKHRKNGEGTLFKRKDGRWQASFVPEQGKRLYFYGKTQAEALEKLRKAQQEDQKGILPTGSKQRLGEYLIQWLESTHRPPMVRHATYVQYRTIIHRHLIPGLGQIFVYKLTPQHIQTFYAQKLKEGLKPRSILVIQAVLHNALENAVKWSLASRNAASLVSVPRAEVHEVHPLTSDEAHKLIEAAQDHWLQPILILAITTGMRRGELLGLRWEDIDLKKGVLHVRRTMNKYSGFDVVENDPKTRASRRRILLPDVAIHALKNQCVLQDATRVKSDGKWQEKNLVFTNQCGDFLDPRKVVWHFHALLEKAGLPRMRFHDLRHSAATILLTMGVHPKVVQELLGHSTIAMTIDTYSHLLPSVQRDAVDKMNDAFRFGSQNSENWGKS